MLIFDVYKNSKQTKADYCWSEDPGPRYLELHFESCISRSVVRESGLPQFCFDGVICVCALWSSQCFLCKMSIYISDIPLFLLTTLKSGKRKLSENNFERTIYIEVWKFEERKMFSILDANFTMHEVEFRRRSIWLSHVKWIFRKENWLVGTD